MTYKTLYLALTAIRLRCNNPGAELAAEIARIADDALMGASPDNEPEDRGEKFDIVRVDGHAAFEVEVRAIEPKLIE
jgi:hypothetical protein